MKISINQARYWALLISGLIIALGVAGFSYYYGDITFTYRNDDVNVIFTYPGHTKISGYAHPFYYNEAGAQYDYQLKVTLPDTHQEIFISDSQICPGSYSEASDAQHIIVGSYKYYRLTYPISSSQKIICFYPYSDYRPNVEFDSLYIYGLVTNVDEEEKLDSFVRGVSIVGQNEIITKDEKTGWFVYRSETHGYELMFPPEWRMHTVNYPHFIKQDLDGRIIFVNSTNDEKMNFYATQSCGEIASLDDCIRSYVRNFHEEENISEVIINGKAALQNVSVNEEYKSLTYAFNENGLYFVLHFWHNKADTDLIGKQNRFLSSLEFITSE